MSGRARKQLVRETGGNRAIHVVADAGIGMEPQSPHGLRPQGVADELHETLLVQRTIHIEGVLVQAI